MFNDKRIWHTKLLFLYCVPLNIVQEITLEVMERKPAMIASLSPKTAEDAPLHDDGSIPGDGLGQSHCHHYHYHYHSHYHQELRGWTARYSHT